MTNGVYDDGQCVTQEPRSRLQAQGMAQAGATAATPQQTVFDEFANRIIDYRHLAADISADLRNKVDRILGSELPSDTPVLGKEGNEQSAGIDRVLRQLDQLGYELNQVQQQVSRMSTFCGN